MSQIYTVITNTPLWVWPLLLVLLWLGFQASRPRTTPLWRITIIPGALFVMSFSTAAITASTLELTFAWLFGLAGGTWCGWLTDQGSELRVDRENRLIFFPGEWRTLGLILVIFLLRYYHG